jgi:hypothetical protein
MIEMCPEKHPVTRGFDENLMKTNGEMNGETNLPNWDYENLV